MLRPDYQVGEAMAEQRRVEGLEVDDVAKRMGKGRAFVLDLEEGRRSWTPKLVRAYRRALD